MTHLLDTNTCIQVIRPKGNPLVKKRYAAEPPGDLALCSVVAGELLYGAERSADPPAERAKVYAFLAPHPMLNYDLPAAVEFARVRAGLAATGLLIGVQDTMIAAVALVHGLTLVTHNTKEFSRVPGLTLEDWEIT